MKKSLLTILAIGLVFLLLPSDLASQQKTLTVTMESQQMNQWCWAASSQCLVRQRTGNYYTQQAYVQYIKGAVVNQPGTTQEIVRACQAGGASVSSTGALTMTGIKSVINANKCFIVGRSGHATVGFGYYNSTHVAIADPWPGTGKSWYTIGNLQSGWFMTVR
jgi:hypothetical protein